MTPIQEAMQKPINFLKESVKGLHSKTITPALVGTVKVIYYGQSTPISQVASISLVATSSNRQISIEPYDKTLMGPITTALKGAGFNAYPFSKTQICVSVPPPSGDEKERVNKRVRQLGEEARVAVRNIRKKFKKTVDEKELQDVTDQATSIINDIVAKTLQ